MPYQKGRGAGYAYPAAVSRALVDREILAKHSALVFVDRLLLVGFIGLMSLSQRSSALASYTAVQAGMALLALTGFALHLRLRYMRPEAGWRRFGAAWLFVLTFLSSAITAVLFAHDDGRGPLPLSGLAKLSLGLVPPIGVFALVALLLVFWWRSLLHSKESDIPLAPPRPRVVKEEVALAMTQNPLARKRPSVGGKGKRAAEPGTPRMPTAPRAAPIPREEGGEAMEGGGAAVAPEPNPQSPEPAPEAQQQPAPDPVPAPLAPELDPLPPGWEMKVSRSTGKTYYVNAGTKETVWERPSAVLSPDLGAPELDALPPGWEEKLSKSTGRTYYVNASTMETVWERPGAAAATLPSAEAAAAATLPSAAPWPSPQMGPLDSAPPLRRWRSPRCSTLPKSPPRSGPPCRGPCRSGPSWGP